jgi:hypothetical protein
VPGVNTTPDSSVIRTSVNRGWMDMSLLLSNSESGVTPNGMEGAVRRGT